MNTQNSTHSPKTILDRALVHMRKVSIVFNIHLSATVLLFGLLVFSPPRAQAQPTIQISTQNQTVTARSQSRVVWQFETSNPEPSLEAREEEVAYVVDGKGYRTSSSQVYAIEVSSGTVLWIQEIGGYTRAEIWDIHEESVIVGHTSGIYALDREDGDPVWKYDDFQESPTTYTVSNGILLFLDGSPAYAGSGSRSTSRLHAVELETGEGLWSTKVAERQARPTGDASYEVTGDVVITKNKKTGRTYRVDLRTGETLANSGPSRCSSARTAEIVESAFGPFTPSQITPNVTADLNGDESEERFYQQMGTNSQGQIKVIAITGAAPCRQIFSTIVYDSEWGKQLTVLDREQNGYRVIELGSRTYTFDGKRYTQN